ncbi:hypothetical protein cce_4949 [Crocosphaera subtropica ATCC 51142]|uniref:Uncharacterized protein n=2 Tax=Cyanobacteriota TaxID=1117 RepID=B1X2D4_CROS5|nr:hypothetical protein cce_4949 [Crocosphaera subtropica ATCC 51142]
MVYSNRELMKMTPKQLELIQQSQRAVSNVETDPEAPQSEEKCWNIPVTWTCWGMYKVPKSQCSTIDDAIAFVEKEPLPDQGEYVDDSMRIDMEGLSIHNSSEEEI